MSTLQELGQYLLTAMDAKRRIASVRASTVDGKTGASVAYKDGTSVFVPITHTLSEGLLWNGTVIVANTKENVSTLIDAWQKAVSFPLLTIVFLDEKTGNKWLLRPKVHAMIAEPKTIGQGLYSLYEQSLIA